ncbi:hypothetical protein KNT64_gp185 [Pseudomonas phage PspYZU05]|uniref:Uncharacterized protein n=1 Tax=Pseudomonas phage PspYZU05 TaxID=1983556 RepID=A0A2U7NN45_9CAUD|nr:hypothetical protein KNT64_gp185 [Pseudomonas phage PspYZU05]ASD52137.1 hypothetical protein PspYZU05_185 [Pseudomonas phage PspYZU05]
MKELKRFRVTQQWSGYVRGCTDMVVEAESEEEAIVNAKYGIGIISSDENIIRDDRDKDEPEVY